MKKILLPLLAVCSCAVTVYAEELDYGTSMETAKPFPSTGWTAPDGVTEAWFIISNPESEVKMLNMSNSEELTVYFKGGLKALTGPLPGSFALLPNEEFYLQIKPYTSSEVGLPWYGANYIGTAPGGSYLMAIPSSRAVPGEHPYCPINRTNEWGGTSEIIVQPNSTVWMLTDFVGQPTQLSVAKNSWNAAATGDVTKVTVMEVYHIDGTGHYAADDCGTFGGPYVKGGRNVVGITYGDASEPLQFMLNADPNIFSCGYKFERALDTQKMTLDQAVYYVDGYYTADYVFTVPEDGDYTFINHGAAETVLTVGSTYYEKDEYDVDRLRGNFDQSKSAIVGDNDAKVVFNAKKNDILFVRSDAFAHSGATSMAERPYLKVVSGDQAGIADVVADAENTIKAVVNNGRLYIESSLLSDGADVAVYDMMGRKVVSVVSDGGASDISFDLNVNQGVYVVAVSGQGNVGTVKIAVK